MDRFIWGRDYKTGVAAMDAEHVILFSVYNQLASVIDSEREREALDDIIGALVSYIKLHFAHEEALLEKAEYSGLAAHRAAHRTIIADLDALYGDYLRAADSIAVARNLRSFVLSWLSGHILKDDKAYAAEISGR